MIEQIKREIKNAIEQQVRNATNMPNGMTSIRDEIKEKLDALKCHEIYSRFFKSYEYTLEFIFNDELKSVLMNITCNVVIGKELLEFQLFHLYQRAEIFHRIARIDPELKRACIRVIK